MNTANLLAAGFAIALLTGWYSTDAHAAELCHTPTPQTLISWYNTTYPDKPLHYDSRSSAIYHPIATLRTASPRLTWIGLAWLAPVSGALFVSDCDGKPQSAVPLGAVGKLTAGPVLPILGQTVMVEYVDHETSDCVHDSIGILALQDGKIVSLWDHESKQGMNIAAEHTTSHGFVSRNYTVTFTGDVPTLQVTGQLSAYPFLKDGSQSATPSASEPLPAESYRWDAGKLRFVAQGKYRHFKPCISADRPSAK